MSLNVMKMAILWLSAVSGLGSCDWGVFCIEFFDKDYRTILGLLAEPRKR
jgi:hypothetical protein